MSSEPTHGPARSDVAGTGSALLDRTVDDADRVVTFERYRSERYGDVTAMYADFAPEHRAQGLPPATDAARTEWLSVVLDELSVLAVHDDAVVGHAVLVSDDAGGHELGVFVHQDHQGAGVGTALLETTFEYARSVGVTDVWLTVAQSNHRARHVYEQLGFTETTTNGRSVRFTRSL